MRAAWVATAGLVVIGFAVVALVAREHTPASAQSRTPRQVAAPDSKSAMPDAANPSSSLDDESVPQNTSVSRDLEKELMDSEDFWGFAEKLLVEAKAGDGAAQFYLSIALSECDAFGTNYFKDGDRRLTYDEAMQHAVQRGGFKWEYVSRVFKRCKRLIEAKNPPFGTADAWMNAAIASGYPRAQAQAAVGKAWKSRYEEQKERASELREEARHLALAALRTKDPGAMFMVGSAASVLDKREGDANPHEWVWMLAACERGYDCSRESAWYQFRCAYDPQCQPYENGIVDVVRRETGSRFSDLERRAKELNARMDEGRFDELGI